MNVLILMRMMTQGEIAGCEILETVYKTSNTWRVFQMQMKLE